MLFSLMARIENRLTKTEKIDLPCQFPLERYYPSKINKEIVELPRNFELNLRMLVIFFVEAKIKKKKKGIYRTAFI